jgi:DNA-directed RNA polymerase specialized sigma subunit
MIFFIQILFSFSRQLFSSVNEEEKTNDSSPIITDNEQGTENKHDNKYSNHDNGNQIHIDKLIQNLNKKQRRILNREYQRQGNNCCL